MSVTNGICWYPSNRVQDVRALDTKVFQVKETGEVFSSYEEYLARMRSLKGNHTASQGGGRNGLTLEKANREDGSTDVLVAKFPKDLEERALRRIHHSSLPLDQLVNEIHSLQSSPASSHKENMNGLANGSQTDDDGYIASRESIRCWLLQAAKRQRHGSMDLWIAQPALQQRHRLADSLPDSSREAAAGNYAHMNGAIPERPSAAAKSLPKEKKRKQTEEGQEQKKPKKQKATKPASSGLQNDTNRQEPPPLRTLEEEEARLRPGTRKAVVFQVLKRATADGMTILQIKEAAEAAGLSDFTDNYKSILSAVITSDPTFVRVKKGCYALRCCMKDAQFESVCGCAKKPASMAAPAEQRPVSPHKEANTSVQKRQNVDAETDLVKVKEPEPPLKTLEEEEARLRPGSKKAIVFETLKVVGSGGVSVVNLLQAVRQHREWSEAEGDKKILHMILAGDSAFVRIRKGVYGLRALMGDRPYESVGGQKSSKAPKLTPAGVEQPGKQIQAQPLDLRASSPPKDEEVDSLPKAELMEVQVRKAVEARTQALQKAMAAEARAHARIFASSPEPATPSKQYSLAALGPRPSADLTQEMKAFRGDPNNEQDIRAHSERIAALSEEVTAKGLAWEQAHEHITREKEQARAQRALKSAQKRVGTCRGEVEAACLALKEAVKAADKERGRKAAAEKKAEEKKQREEVRAAERERKQADALEAKRYPMEDLQLLEELRAKAVTDGRSLVKEDVPLPSNWLSKEDSAATTGMLFAADLLAQFAKTLKLKAVPFQTLLRFLEGDASQEESSDAIWEVYQNLLAIAVQEIGDDDEEAKWLGYIERATISEVLAQYIIYCRHTSPTLVTPELEAAAGALSGAALDQIPGLHLHVLLNFLCNEVLNSEQMRDALQERLDESSDVKREMKGAVAEKKGELKELLDAEKEERKRKREEERAAKKAKEHLQNGLQEAASAVDKPAEQTAEADTEGAPEAAALSEVTEEEAEEIEPSWELPAELQNYQGDPDDRKSMLTFRQTQQSARQKLEKERERWQKRAQAREKAREARVRALAEAEQAKADAKAAAEEEVLRKQQELERELEKYSLRRLPLGYDRHHRRYWWNLASQRPLVYVEREDACLVALKTPEELDALMQSLDKRGLRELALYNALEKVQPAIVQAMRKAQAEGKAAAKETDGAERFPKRQRIQAVFFSPSKNQAAAGQPAKATGGLSAGSLAAAADSLQELHVDLSKWGATPPAEGWKGWSRELRAAVKEAESALQGSGLQTGDSFGALKACMLSLEDMLQEIGRQSQGDQAPRNESDAGGADEETDEEKNRLWGTKKEHAKWIAFVTEAGTLAAAALAAWRLQEAGAKLLSSIGKPKNKPQASKAKISERQSQAKSTRSALKTQPEPEPSKSKASKKGNASVEHKGKIQANEEPKQVRITRSRGR